MLLINRENSDQPKHLCVFFKASLFKKKFIGHTNIQQYKAKAENWF